MSQSKKTASSKSKPMADVAHPGTTAPSDTSKPIINQRPIMKDPMVVEDDKLEDSAKKPLPKKTSETKITPPEEPVEKTAGPKSDPEPGPESETDKTGPEPTEDKDTDAKADNMDKKDQKPDSKAEAAAETAQDAKLRQLIDSKKYFLPLNAVEHRRSRRVAILGFVLALLLALAWVDIALDAGLIRLDNVKPLTHFFSS